MGAEQPAGSFNVGARYDRPFGKNQAGVKTVDDSAFSPRLAATFDPTGNGTHRFSATYGRYVAKVEQGPADLTAPAGRYSYYFFDYGGPEINPAGHAVQPARADPAGHPPGVRVVQRRRRHVNTELLSDISIPGYTTRFDESLSSPYMDEFTVGYALHVRRPRLPARRLHRPHLGRLLRHPPHARDRQGRPIRPGLTVDQGVIENSRRRPEPRLSGRAAAGQYRPWQR